MNFDKVMTVDSADSSLKSLKWKWNHERPNAHVLIYMYIVYKQFAK